MMASLHTSGSFQREHFHPTRERVSPVYDELDPAAEYARLKKQEGK